jgi:hypothetical protein
MQYISLLPKYVKLISGDVSLRVFVYVIAIL